MDIERQVRANLFGFRIWKKREVVVKKQRAGRSRVCLCILQFSSRRIRNLPYLVAVADWCGIFWNNNHFIVHTTAALNPAVPLATPS